MVFRVYGVVYGWFSQSMVPFLGVHIEGEIDIDVDIDTDS